MSNICMYIQPSGCANETVKQFQFVLIGLQILRSQTKNVFKQVF